MPKGWKAFLGYMQLMEEAFVPSMEEAEHALASPWKKHISGKARAEHAEGFSKDTRVLTH